jgi:hypothetical protein
VQRRPTHGFVPPHTAINTSTSGVFFGQELKLMSVESLILTIPTQIQMGRLGSDSIIQGFLDNG